MNTDMSVLFYAGKVVKTEHENTVLAHLASRGMDWATDMYEYQYPDPDGCTPEDKLIIWRQLRKRRSQMLRYWRTVVKKIGQREKAPLSPRERVQFANVMSNGRQLHPRWWPTHGLTVKRLRAYVRSLEGFSQSSWENPHDTEYYSACGYDDYQGELRDDARREAEVVGEVMVALHEATSRGQHTYATLIPSADWERLDFGKIYTWECNGYVSELVDRYGYMLDDLRQSAAATRWVKEFPGNANRTWQAARYMVVVYRPWSDTNLTVQQLHDLYLYMQGLEYWQERNVYGS